MVIHSQAKADVLRRSKRQSFESPMTGSLKLSSLGWRVLTRDWSGSVDLEFLYLCLDSLRELGDTDAALNAQSPSLSSVWRDKGKRFDRYSQLKAQAYNTDHVWQMIQVHLITVHDTPGCFKSCFNWLKYFIIIFSS